MNCTCRESLTAKYVVEIASVNAGAIIEQHDITKGNCCESAMKHL